MQETILALLLTFSPTDQAVKAERGAKPMNGGGTIIIGGKGKESNIQPMNGGGTIIIGGKKTN